MPQIRRTYRHLYGRVPCVALFLFALLTLPSVVPSIPAPFSQPVAFAAEAPGARIVAQPIVAAVAADISPLRRQPFAGTSVTTPTVSFDPASRTITLSAGRVTMPELQQTLRDTYKGTALYTETQGLLVETAPGSAIWQLSANLAIGSAAALTVSAPSATWLRIVGSAALPAPEVKNTGYLLFQQTKVTSWNAQANTVDTNVADQRGYVFTTKGGRTDLYTTEAAYLGWQGGKQAGLSWRNRDKDADPTTGSTGDVHDSNIHDNFAGIQTDTAFALWIARTQIMNNLSAGIDSDNQSNGLIIENNTVSGNATHGISLSRSCYANLIKANTVTKNARFGIIVERRSGSDALELSGAAVAAGANQVSGNTTSNNLEGIVLFQSSGNLIDGNTSSENDTGIRLSATLLAVADATPDSLARQNSITNNTVTNNVSYGISLYARADSNTISGNTVSGNGRHDNDPLSPLGSGIYIKAGGNAVGPNNTVFNNGHGISLVAVDAQGQLLGSSDAPNAPAPAATTAADPGLAAGSQNTVANNHIYGNKSRGLRMSAANNNTVQNNEINTNVAEGIYSDGGSNNLFKSNYIHHNGASSGQVSEGTVDPGSDGVEIKGVGVVGNRLTENRITANGREAIRLGSGANGSIQPPTITAVQANAVSGTALPGALVEVFSDPRNGCGASVCGDEAANFVGAVTAATDGSWQISKATTTGSNYAATQTDTQNNTSELSRQEVAPTVSIGPGRKGEPTLYVSGTNATLNLLQIKNRLAIYSQQVGHPEYANLLSDDGSVEGKRTWTLNISMFISPTVSLLVKGDATLPQAEQVQWLRLFSNPGPEPTPNPADPDHPIYDATKFGTIKTYGGNLLFEDTKVTSWDTTTGTVDQNKGDGRSFVLAKYDSDLTIIRSDMSYLGYADGEAYGVSWRDVNPSTDPVDAPRRTRVTGSAIDSTFSHNYYGIYTFQAQDMVFRGNKMFSNIQYGFDPHDFTHNVLVENNEAYDNGSHGFIISRGCSDFVFRNNVSHDNKVKLGSKNPSAHGFMLDPGADPIKAGVPQSPSVDNLIENNQAYGNDGYAVRVYGSNNNTIRDNLFYNNRAGVTLEHGSTGNLVAGNTIKDSTGEPVVDTTGQTTLKGGYGIYAFQGADGNTVDGNTVTGNINTGIYLKTANNIVQGNTIASNKGDGIGTLLETDSELPPDPPEISAAGDSALIPGAYINDQEPGEWTLADATTPNNNTVVSNTVQLNLDAGISVKGAIGTTIDGNTVASNTADGIYLANGTSDTLVRHNSVNQNGSYGIKVNGADVQRNRLSENAVTGNVSGGIAVTGGANGGILAPKMTVDTTTAEGNGAWRVSGTTLPGMLVEIFTDSGVQAATFAGSIVADENGTFLFESSGPMVGSTVTSTATDGQGNTSALSKPARSFDAPWLDSNYVIYLPFVRQKK